jgi:hypothetical protein
MEKWSPDDWMWMAVVLLMTAWIPVAMLMVTNRLVENL